jgi:hypothetical protein
MMSPFKLLRLLFQRLGVEVVGLAPDRWSRKNEKRLAPWLPGAKYEPTTVVHPVIWDAVTEKYYA